MGKKKKQLKLRRMVPVMPQHYVDPRLDTTLEERCKREAREESNASIKKLSEKYGGRPPGSP